MPRNKISKSELCRRYVFEYGNTFRKTVDDRLLCNFCYIEIDISRKSNITSHIKTKKHTELSVRDQNRIQTTLIDESPDASKMIVEAFLSADIPLQKLRHPKIKALFKHFKIPIPSETSARRQLDILAEIKFKNICQILENKEIFLISDESEINNKKYFNVLVGDILDPSSVYLVDTVELDESLNAKIIIHNTEMIFEKLNINIKNFVLYITDAAPYMIKSGKIFKEKNKKLIHVSCLAHLIHNCAMIVKSQYAATNKLISSVKMATVKNKTRINLFKRIGRPPDVIITRWSSWIRAALYYSDNLIEIKKIIQEEFEDDGVLVENTKQAVQSVSLYNELVSIKKNYTTLIDIIDTFEGGMYTIETGYLSVKNIYLGDDPLNLKEYIRNRLEKNGMSELMEMKNDEISPSLYLALIKCPPTSILVERSFSMLKKLLVKDRNFAKGNVYKYFTFYYNSFKDTD